MTSPRPAAPVETAPEQEVKHQVNEKIQAWRLDETDAPDCRTAGDDEGPSCVSIAKSPTVPPSAGGK